jgi:hypothetical protein
MLVEFDDMAALKRRIETARSQSKLRVSAISAKLQDMACKKSPVFRTRLIACASLSHCQTEVCPVAVFGTSHATV